MYRDKNGEIESKLFDSDDIPAGWRDAPGKPKKSPADDAETSASDVRDVLDIDSMTKEELELFARGHGLELDRRKKISTLREQVKEHLEG
jgi:hypothetical protein